MAATMRSSSSAEAGDLDSSSARFGAGDCGGVVGSSISSKLISEAAETVGSNINLHPGIMCEVNIFNSLQVNHDVYIFTDEN